MNNLSWLNGAGDPIQCVALFHELANALETGPDYNCTVPIGFDASCSGLQHYALLARDYQTALRANLVGSGAPRDIYGEILAHVRSRLSARASEDDAGAAWWLKHVDRKIIKRLVMTYCYSSVPHGQADQIYAELHRRKIVIPDDAPKNLVSRLVSLTRHAIEIFVPLAEEIRRQLRARVDKKTPVRWVSPSGLPVANSYPKPRTESVRHYLHDKSVRCVVAAEWKKEQRVGKAKAAIAPNYVHSFDASHLALVACACEREGIPLVTVHDSFGTLPCYADRLRAILLEELRNMYADYRPSPRPLVVPPVGDLDLNDVTGEYAFS